MQIAAPFVITPSVLAAILAVSILVVSGFSIAFIYHWREYGMDTRLIRLAPVLYLSVAAGLCVFAVVSYLALL